MPAFSRVALLPALFGVVISACGGASGGAGASAPAAGANANASEVAAQESPPAGPPREIDCGDFTTCAVATDGLVRCWGRGKEGELGDGTGKGERAKRGVVPGVGKVKKVALASRFGCAIVEDDTVKCWGSGHIANDGRPFTDSKAVAVANVDGVEELVASGAIACARGAKGVTCWGTNDNAIGAAPKGPFSQISVGFTHACALGSGGTVACWGPADWGGKGAFAKPPVTGATQVVTGDRHGCVLTKGKTVQCWGMNDAGQLGLKPDVEAHKKLVTVPGIANAVRLVAGEASTCALLGDGSVRCWGANGEGELGLGTRSTDERPARVSALENVEQLCLASAHGCALTKESKLLCWGSNAFGQLGDGTKERRATPTAVVW